MNLCWLVSSTRPTWILYWSYPVQGAGWSRRKAKGMGLFHLGRPKTEGFWDTQCVFLAQLLAIDMQTISANPSNDYWFLVSLHGNVQQIGSRNAKKAKRDLFCQPPYKMIHFCAAFQAPPLCRHTEGWKLSEVLGKLVAPTDQMLETMSIGMNSHDLLWAHGCGPNMGYQWGQIGQPS